MSPNLVCHSTPLPFFPAIFLPLDDRPSQAKPSQAKLRQKLKADGLPPETPSPLKKKTSRQMSRVESSKSQLVLNCLSQTSLTYFITRRRWFHFRFRFQRRCRCPNRSRSCRSSARRCPSARRSFVASVEGQQRLGPAGRAS